VQQRRGFSNLFNSLGKDEAIIIVDFKENLKLPISSREVSRNFYCRQQISILTFLLIWNDGTKKVFDHYTFASEVLNHDHLFIRDCLQEMVSKPTFPKFNYTFFFSDNAAVFRCKAYFSLILECQPLSEKLGERWLNFFNQYHGKSYCDSFFGLLSNYLHRFSFKQNIPDIDELLVACKKMESSSDRIKASNYYFFQFHLSDFAHFFLFFFDRYDRTEQTLDIPTLEVTDNKSALSFYKSPSGILGAPFLSREKCFYKLFHSKEKTGEFIFEAKKFHRIKEQFPDLIMGSQTENYLRERSEWIEEFHGGIGFLLLSLITLFHLLSIC
jgi:hypothetical protein